MILSLLNPHSKRYPFPHMTTLSYFAQTVILDSKSRMTTPYSQLRISLIWQ